MGKDQGRASTALSCLMVACAVGVARPGTVAAQSSPAMELVRLSGPIDFDGMPDEAIWQEVPSLPLTM